jgi:SWI2/SNF2 ATPase
MADDFEDWSAPPAASFELISDFVLFAGDGVRSWKVMAKYNRVHAVHAAVESAVAAMKDDGRGGIAWHTQGAGKSYTMVFFVNKLHRDARFANPTIVAVTDRTDLDNSCSALSPAPTSRHLACRRSGSPETRRELRREHQARAARRDACLVHRDAHRKCRPLDAARGSATTYLSACARRRKIEPPVPIYYESRPIKIEIEDRARLAEVEEILEEEEQEAASKLVTNWGQAREGSRRRLG